MDRFHYWLAVFQVTIYERRVNAIHSVASLRMQPIFFVIIDIL